MFCKTLGCLITVVCFVASTQAADIGQHVGCFKRSSHNLTKVVLTNCNDFCASQFYRYSVFFDDKCSCENKLKEREEEKTNCDRKCRYDDEEISCGGSSTEDIYETGSNLAGPVEQFRVLNATQDKISVTWDAPERNGSELTGYEINAVVLQTFSKTPWAMRNQTWKIQKSSPRSFDLSNLHPSTKYQIVISSKNNDLSGGESSIVASTRLAKPETPEAPKLVGSQTPDGRLKIELIRPTNENGPISGLLLVIHFIDDELIHDFDEQLLSTYQKAKDDGLGYYITAEIDPFPEASKTFEIGNGKYVGQYYNAPLPNRHLHVLLGVRSRFNNDELVSYSTFSHDEKLHVTVLHPANSEGTSDSLVVILTIACYLGGLILLGAVLFYGYIRMMRVNPRISRFERHEMSLQGPILEVDNNGYVGENLFDVTGTNFKEKLQEILRLSLDDDQKIIRKNLSLDIDNILGIGSFGDVIRGELNGNIPCQVHVCQDDMEPAIQIKFIRDLNSLLQFNYHKNMQNFLGICQTHDWIFLTFEDTPMTLKQFLVSHRDEQSLSHTKLTRLPEEQALRLMFEFSETVDYMAQNKIVHKNLNSHNVRIKLRQSSAPVLQVTYFGPTLYNISEEGVKSLVDDERWFAPEVMRFQKYSHASDVYSTALVMWEIATVGATVYGSIATSELFARIKKGFRPERSFLSEDLYGLLWNCWELEPNERCNVSDLVGQLKHFLQIPHYYLNYSTEASSSLPYYLPLLEIKN